MAVEFGCFFVAGGASSAKKATFADRFFIGLYMYERKILVFAWGEGTTFASNAWASLILAHRQLSEAQKTGDTASIRDVGFP